MRPKRRLATTSFAGAVLAMTLLTGATPALCPIEQHVASSYRCVVEVYDRARAWGTILRWWVDPEFGAPAGQAKQNAHQPKTEDVCQARPAEAEAR